MGLTNAERQRRYIQRLKEQAAKAGVSNAAPASKPVERAFDPELLARYAALQAENETLKAQLAQLKSDAAKPAKAPPDELAEALAKIEQLSEQLEGARDIIRSERKRFNDSKPRVPKKIPFAVKNKMAKALTEDTTSTESRLDALQAWNGLGVNKG